MSKPSTPVYRPGKDKSIRLKLPSDQSVEAESVVRSQKPLMTESMNSLESLLDKKNKKGKKRVKEMIKQRTDVIEQQKEQEKKKAREREKKKNWKEALLDNSLFELTVSLATVFALFGDDIRLAATDRPSDIYFDVGNSIVIVLFIFEIYVTCKVRKHFLFSFFFWLDLVSTLTLILDITFVSALLYTDPAASTLSFASVGRAGRVGTKAGRIVRIIKIFRIL